MAILRKLPAAVAVAALTATLVGCGSSDVRDERDQALMERDAAQAELEQTQTELQTELEAAQAELEAAQAEAEAAQAEAEAQLEMERMQAEEAAAEAAAAAEQALMEEEAARMAAEEALKTAEGERDALQETADEATTAADIATAKALLASLQDADPDAVPAGGDAMRRPLGYPTTAGVGRQYGATLEDPNPDTFPVLGGTLYTTVSLLAIPDAATPATIVDATPLVYARVPDPAAPSGANSRAKVTASSDGEVAVAVTGYTQTTNVPDMIEGFRGVELEKPAATSHRQAWVYTDIDDATAGSGSAKLEALYHFTSVPGEKTFSVDPRGDDAEEDAIPWGAVTRIGSAITTVGPTGAEQLTSFAGSVKGVSGTFWCTGTCTAPATNPNTGVVGDTSDATGDGRNDGFVTADDSTGTGAPAGTWTFTVDPGATIDVADDDGYLAFGWWLHKRGDDKPTAERMNVATFAQAYGLAPRRPEQTVDATTRAVTAITTPSAKADTPQIAGNGVFLTGTATYSGGAAGKYAIAESTTDSAEGGHFTANATLTADFDADSDGNIGNGNDVDGIKLTGMIDNFMTGDMARDWTVSLSYDANSGAVNGTSDAQEASRTDAALGRYMESPTMLGDIGTGAGFDVSGVCAGFTGANAGTSAGCGVASAAWDLGGASPGRGGWSATYYGASAGLETDHPTAIIGRFGAGIRGVAQITGAFGATMDMEEEMADN